MQPDLGPIRWRLTRRYALISSLVLLAFGVGVYWQVAEARGRLMHAQLQQLASAAAAQMPLILHELEEYRKSHPQASRAELTQVGVLDTQAMNLEGKRIIWLDHHLAELSRYGTYQPRGGTPMPRARLQQKQFLALSDGLAYWRPVHVRPSAGVPAELEGYVSVALSSASANEELLRLRNGLLAGGAGAAVTAVLLSQWMVASSLKPIREQIQRLVRFTADASHELRHPLTAIRAVIGSLRQGGWLAQADPRLAGKVELIDQATTQMADLVQDLLLLARLDRSVPDNSHWIQFDLADLIDDLCALNQERARQQSVRLQATLTRPALVRGHPERLRQLLSNLLANALQFSPPGGEVCLSIGRSGRWLEVAVEDQGPGIPPEQRELVFERFWQVDRARNGSNTGLGLAIARGLAQSHGGSLEAREGRQGGCRMVLHLPAA